MADKIERHQPTDLPLLYHDNGDGSYTPTVYNTAAGGGGGGAVTVADGADVAQGATTDLSSANTVVGLLKNLKAALAGTLAVSAASLPLPTGAATSAKQDTSNVSLADIDTQATAIATATGTQADASSASSIIGLLKNLKAALAGTLTVDASGHTVPVSGTFWQATQPVSGSVTADTELPAAAALSDAIGNPTTPMVGSAGMVWDGTQWVRMRSPTVFKLVPGLSSAGNNAVWTPAAGKKWRLMGYQIMVSGNSVRAAAGAMTFKFQDGTSDIGLGINIFIPGSAGSTMGNDYVGQVFQIPGAGILSAAANNVLNLNLPAALTTGNATVIVWGVEE